jgi:hypothetical protein
MYTMVWSTSELVTLYQRLSSGHFFDKDTMRFFKSRLTENFKRLSDTEALFITTERFDHTTPRRATIRRASLVKSDTWYGVKIKIETVGEFNKLTLSQAKNLLKKMS